jgi:hypothetical protein
MVLPLRSEWRTSTNLRIVLTACCIFFPSIDPDVSRRKPAMTLRGSVVVAVSSICGICISSFPNRLLSAVRLSTRARIFVGRNLWERIPLSVVVSLVESMVDVWVGTLLLKYIVEIHFNFFPRGFRGGSAGVPPPNDGDGITPAVNIDRR